MIRHSDTKTWLRDKSDSKTSRPRRSYSYDLYSGSSSPEDVEGDTYQFAKSRTDNSVTPANPNSERSQSFYALAESIGRLSLLPEHDPMHIDKQTSEQATTLAALIGSSFEIDPPKLFPQDGEALVFTWDLGEQIRRLLTIAGEEVSLLDIQKRTQTRCYHDIADGARSWKDLMPLLSKTHFVRSSTSDD